MIKNQNKKYECNLQILKVVIQAVLLCLKQSLPLHGDQEYGKSDVTREKRTDEKTQRSDFHTAPNSFAMLDPMLDPVSMLDPISFPMLDLIQKFFYCVCVMLFSITISQRLVKHFWIHYTFKEGQVDTLLEIAFCLCYKETILIFQTCNIDIAQACNAASAMSSDS